uniref:response regulator n=1 Tax=Acetatifactor sp. TaxID=1872090 RepID=UPI00405742B2
MFKILIVEDDKDLNQTVCAYLSRNGYEAIGCLSANEAYNEMYSKLFDMIISDIMMPQIDGYEFARTVREMNQDIPRTFASSRSTS